MDDIIVSICCLTYNHEKYIRQMLESLLCQKTNFKYEILIHDDASTDGTKSIIREYEEKYPDIIKPIYQKENQHSKGVRISLTYQYPRISGKYIAFCEGDDFWCDENKLQRQYDLMEQNPDAVICTHRVECVDETAKKTVGFYPTCSFNDCFLSQEEFFNYLLDENYYPFHTTSYFVRTSLMKKLLFNIPDFYTAFPAGDVTLLLYAATMGGLIYFDDVCSKYRILSVSSISRKLENRDIKIMYSKRFIEAFQLYDKYTNKIKHEQIKKIVTKYEFNFFIAQENMRELRNKKYRFVIENAPSKTKIRYIVMIYFNGLYRLLRYFKKKLSKIIMLVYRKKAN